MDLRHAEEQRRHWRSLIAHQVVSDPLLLSIVRLCGVRELVAFALGAIIGDIQRFASPAKLVKYVGFDPAFDDSGNEEWRGGIGAKICAASSSSQRKPSCAPAIPWRSGAKSCSRAKAL
jgi:transposase